MLIALFVTLGMLFRRFEAFPPETVRVLNMFALYISLPALILLKVPQISFSGEILTPLLIAWGALIISAGLVLAAGRFFSWPSSAIGVLMLVVPIGNTSFMGVPIINAFFGERGLRHLIVYDQLGTMLIFATYGSLILASYGNEGAVSCAGQQLAPCCSPLPLPWQADFCCCRGAILCCWCRYCTAQQEP